MAWVSCTFFFFFLYNFICLLLPLFTPRFFFLKRETRLSHPPSTSILFPFRLLTLKGAINTTDPTWDNVPTSYWSEIELNTGIICASAATLRPLLRRVIPGLSNKGHSYYPEKKGASGSSDGQRSAAGHLATIGGSSAAAAASSVPDMYALRDCSQDGLRDNAAYEAAPHARHPGPSAELRTAIYGGLAGDAISEESIGVAKEIRVTRETTIRETRDDKGKR